MESATNWQGMRWIRNSTRFAVYAASGFACVYCGRDAGRCRTRGRFGLDHKVPRAWGGSNAVSNVTMACTACNGAKGDRDVEAYLTVLADAGRDVAPIRARIAAAARAQLDRALGRDLARAGDRGASLATLAKRARGAVAAAAS